MLLQPASGSVSLGLPTSPQTPVLKLDLTVPRAPAPEEAIDAAIACCVRVVIHQQVIVRELATQGFGTVDARGCGVTDPFPLDDPAFEDGNGHRCPHGRASKPETALTCNVDDEIPDREDAEQRVTLCSASAAVNRAFFFASSGRFVESRNAPGSQGWGLRPSRLATRLNPQQGVGPTPLDPLLPYPATPRCYALSLKAPWPLTRYP